MARTHHYEATLQWTGAAAGPTRDYAGYSRTYVATLPGKAPIEGSADPTFRGDPKLVNPEEMLVVALSACHMLSYLAECARAGIAVVAYEDQASGTMALRDGKVRFTEVMLRPRVRVSPGSDLARARELHHKAHDVCFIASSVDFPVRNEPAVEVAG